MQIGTRFLFSYQRGRDYNIISPVDRGHWQGCKWASCLHRGPHKALTCVALGPLVLQGNINPHPEISPCYGLSRKCQRGFIFMELLQFLLSFVPLSACVGPVEAVCRVPLLPAPLGKLGGCGHWAQSSLCRVSCLFSSPP